MASQHQLFLSYARADNQPVAPATIGWVGAFKARLEQRHKGFSGRPLNMFYDAESLREGDDWETKIGQALRSSQLLLAFLSPAFFKSAWCRREWEEYLRVEHSLSRSDGGIVPVYFAHVPELDPQQQDALEAQFKDWAAEINRVQRGGLIDISPWYDGGAEALLALDAQARLDDLAAAPRADATLRPKDFVDQLAQLDKTIAARLDLALLAEQAQSGGFLTASYEHFVGRGADLRKLHKLLSTEKIGLIAALHGLGGQGKSALAVQYGYAYAGYYACGGRWLVGCEGRASVLEVLERLAVLIGQPLSEAELKFEQPVQIALYAQRLRAHCEAGKARITALLKEQGGDWYTPVEQRDVNIAARMLVTLDNVDQPGLLSGTELGALPKSDWLDLLVTSRLGPHELNIDDHAAIEIGDLPEADALALLRSYHPFADAAEEAAARELVRMLYGHVLSIDLVGAHVASQAKAKYGYAAMRDALKVLGVGAFEVDEFGKARSDIRAEKTAKTIGAIIDQTWAKLAPVEQRVMEFASLCPPDLVATDWLRMLVEQEFPELADPEVPSAIAPPWATLLERLDGRRLLRDNRAEGNAEPNASIHRLVAETVRARIDAATLAARREALIALADWLGATLEYRARSVFGLAQRWLRPLIALTRALTEEALPDLRLTSNLGVCATFAMRLGGIAAAQSLLEERHRSAVAAAKINPGDTRVQRDLSVSQNNLGDFYQRRGGAGDTARALEAYEASLANRKKVALTNPHDAQAQRDLSISQQRMGDFYLRRGGAGDAERALAAYQASLAADEELVAANPADARAQRDLSVSQTKIGDFYQRRGGAGDAERALAAYQASLATAVTLTAANPDDAQAQRDLSVAQTKLGDFYQRRGGAGDAERALAAYQTSLEADEKLVVANPDDAQAQRDLSVSYQRMGDFYQRRSSAGDGERAQRTYQASLDILQKLAATNPDDGEAQRDLAVSQNKLGDFYLGRGGVGDAERALAAYQVSLATRERLATANPRDARAQRDRSVSQERLGDFYRRRGGEGDAERALAYFKEAAACRWRIAENNLGIGELQAEAAVPLTRTVFALVALGREGGLGPVLERLHQLVSHYDAQDFDQDGRIEGARELLQKLGLWGGAA